MNKGIPNMSTQQNRNKYFFLQKLFAKLKAK